MRGARDDSEELQMDEGGTDLVSFLTGYQQDHASDEGLDPGDEDDEDRRASEDDQGEVDEDEDDEDEDDGATPRKMGLLASGASTPRSKRGTPKKNKTPGSTNSTPRKTPKRVREWEDDGDGGIIRPSKADAYFTLMAQSGKTSGNSYSLLAEPLSQQAYGRYTKEISKAREKICPPETFELKFHQWAKELEAGFNLLFYGFGSKRPTLNLFAQKVLAKKGNVVVVNGLFPGLGLKEIISEAEDRLGVPQNIAVPPSCSNPLERAVYRLYAHLLPPLAIPARSKMAWPVSERPLYIIIHNLDAPSLRSVKSIALLSLLASSPRIHILASYDHVHTPLIFPASLSNSPPHLYPPGQWDGVPQISRGFNWVHHNLTTYAPYDLELSYLRLSAHSLTVSSGGAGGVSEEGAIQILKSVTEMAVRLFKLLLMLQVSRLPSNPKWHVAYPSQQPGGMAPPFAVEDTDIKRKANVEFIAKEDERFETLLGEFKDHGLVVEAAVGSDEIEGQEKAEGRWFWVPLGKAALERLLEGMKDVVLTNDYL